MATPSLHVLDALRCATAEAHRRLDGELDVFRRVCTPLAYRQMLARMYPVHRGLEAFWKQVSPPGRARRWDLAARHKSPKLAGDLVALGLSPQAVSRLPICAVPPHWSGAHDCLGSLYVVEGATLGGQVMARHFARCLGVGPSAGGDYLAGYGPDTGRQWRRCRALLATELATPDALAVACRAARETFALFAGALIDAAPRGRG